MAKNIFLAILFSVFTGSFVNAQVIHAKWTMTTKKISECEYDLIYSVNIDKGWHITSSAKAKDDETFPTDIVFKPSDDYTLVGNIIESKPTAVFDPTIKKNVFLHYTKAVFTQRVKLKSPGKVKISGTYEYQICDDNRCDFPPKDPFNFELQGSSFCSK